MCTSIAMQQGGGIFGRNLDLECSFGEEVAVMPRRFPLTFRRQEPLALAPGHGGDGPCGGGGAPSMPKR